MTERGDSRAVQPKVTQQTFEESGKLKSFDESGKFRRFDSELYKGASRTSLGVTNSISHSSYNSANEVMMTFMLEAKLNPCAQELQFDLYDYDPRGMEGQPTTVSSIYLFSQCQFDPKSKSLVIGWQTFFTISLVELMLLFSV